MFSSNIFLHSTKPIEIVWRDGQAMYTVDVPILSTEVYVTTSVSYHRIRSSIVAKKDHFFTEFPREFVFYDCS